MSERRRQWPGFLNARSLEGLPTRHGEIGPGRLYRSDEPTADGHAVLRALSEEGIRTVLDLRSEHETTRRPSSLAGRGMYRVAPLVDPRMDHLRDASREKSLLDLYVGSIDRNGRTIAAAIRHLIEAPEGGVLVHCAVGKDRTGILIAVILAVLGTPDAVIVDDYTRTEEADLADFYAAELASIDDPNRRERIASRQHASADTMTGFLGHLNGRFGGASAYLRAHGLSDSDLHQLAERLTDQEFDPHGSAPASAQEDVL